MSEAGSPQPDNAALRQLTGQRVGKYQIVKPLGKGAMGIVYLAHDTVLERDVALKVMVAQIADDPELKTRFEREAKAVAKMTHPNVVQVFDLGQLSDGSPFIAMELLRGKDLQKALRAQPAMPLERKLAIIAHVLAGLAHAHRAGIVHRDVKPANIFLNDDGSVKIMDFGVARLTTASMTGTGNIVGTADYMSPEQVKGAKADGRSDLFSVGCMMFELLSGRRPFHAENLMAIFYKITHDEPDYEVIPGGEEYDPLVAVVRRALAKDLEERYQTAYDFALDVRACLNSVATSAGARHVLENLVDLEAPPTSLPAPKTFSGSTLVDEAGLATGATIDFSQAATPSRAPAARPGAPPTARRSTTMVPTLVDETGVGALPTSARPGPTQLVRPGPGTGPTGTRVVAPASRAAPRPATEPRPLPRPARAQPSRAPLRFAGAVALVLGGAAAVYFVVLRPAAPVPLPSVAPPVTLAASPLATAAPAEPTPAPPTAPPPTPAPPPTFAAAAGKGAATLRAAQAAFAKGDYARTLREAQAALRNDPHSAGARALADNATQGQQALARVASAEAALAKGDFAQARSEAEAAREIAPWEARATDLLARIRDAQERAALQAQQARQQENAARIATLLSQADAALAARKHDEALGFYDEALKLDPANQRASLGRTGAIAAKATSVAAPPSGKAFMPGKTVAAGRPTGGSLPPGFEDSPEATVKKGTQGADLPGKLQFEVTPATVKAGERYSVRIFLLNEGTAPIQVAGLSLTTTVNGRKAGGAVPPSAKDVAPQQRALLREVSDIWSEDISAWTLDVAVRTARGELYSNQLSWR